PHLVPQGRAQPDGPAPGYASPRAGARRVLRLLRGHRPWAAAAAKKQLLTEAEYREMREKYGQAYKATMGAEAVKGLLKELDLEKLSRQLRADLKDASGQKRMKILKRLEVVEAFRKSGNKPEWMIL